MHRLTATYKIELPYHLRIRRSKEDPLRYNAVIEEFDVEVALVCDGDVGYKEKDDLNFTRIVTQINVSISRDEDSAPPDVIVSEKAKRDFRDRVPWFEKRLDEYRLIAIEAANRVIRFFRYEMRTPNLLEFTGGDKFLNPHWTNETGKEIEPGIITVGGHVIHPRGPLLLGEKDFTEAEDEKLRYVLQNDIAIELHMAFLADAQTSVINGKLRRAVLEMAIACEVAVKGALFANSTTAGATYEYLEEKGRVHIKVIELIDGVAKAVFGQSFKDADPDAYKDIDHLFRARNKVAHRGDLIYRDDCGTKHNVDRPTLAAWWASVETLMSWIDKTLM